MCHNETLIFAHFNANTAWWLDDNNLASKWLRVHVLPYDDIHYRTSYLGRANAYRALWWLHSGDRLFTLHRMQSSLNSRIQEHRIAQKNMVATLYRGVILTGFQATSIHTIWHANGWYIELQYITNSDEQFTIALCIVRFRLQYISVRCSYSTTIQ